MSSTAGASAGGDADGEHSLYLQGERLCQPEGLTGIATRYTRCRDLFLSAICLAATVVLWLPKWVFTLEECYAALAYAIRRTLQMSVKRPRLLKKSLCGWGWP